MTDNDPRKLIRTLVQGGLSPDDLEAILTQISGGGLRGGFAPHTPQMPEMPEPPEETYALTVRVDVDDTTPPVWRRLVLRGDLRLDELHDILQAAFGWEDYHLHKFWPGPEKRVWRGPSFVTEQDLIEGEEGVRETEVQLDQLLRRPGDRLFYTYDFGDDWTHTIKVESVDTLNPDAPPAVCTGGRRPGRWRTAAGRGATTSWCRPIVPVGPRPWTRTSGNGWDPVGTRPPSTSTRSTSASHWPD